MLVGGQDLLSSSNQAIISQDKRYRLVQQSDSNLVLYNERNEALWANGMWNRGVTRTIMETDGNLVSYDASNNSLWASNTFRNPGAYLIMQDDGNLVIYSGTRAIWATGTQGQ